MTKKKKTVSHVFIPADVPGCAVDQYSSNVSAITRNTGRLFIFAADQKIEHLNDDFYGPGIERAANDPEHIFKIARDGSIGALALHAGMLARYASSYNTIDYIVKLNGKTNLVDSQKFDPMSEQLWEIHDLLFMAEEHDIHIRGIGYTIYLGSEYEPAMLAQAAQVVLHAHQQGLVAVLWIYPRAKHIKDTEAPELIAGAAGIGFALGADFVKIHAPHVHDGLSSMQALKVATEAAGNTGVIVSGGEYISAEKLLKNIYDQLDKGGTSGCAIGRNIFQRPYDKAVALSNAIAALVYDKATYQEALKMVEKAK